MIQKQNKSLPNPTIFGRCGFASTSSYLNVFRQLRMARGWEAQWKSETGQGSKPWYVVNTGGLYHPAYIYIIYIWSQAPPYIYIYIFMYIHMYNKPFNVSKYGEVISDPPTIRCFQTGNILFFDCCARGSLCIHPPIVYWFSRPFHILFIFYALLLHIFVWWLGYCTHSCFLFMLI